MQFAAPANEISVAAATAAAQFVFHVRNARYFLAVDEKKKIMAPKNPLSQEEEVVILCPDWLWQGDKEGKFMFASLLGMFLSDSVKCWTSKVENGIDSFFFFFILQRVSFSSC